MGRVNIGDNMNIGFVAQGKEEVETKSKDIEDIVIKVISKYSLDLDNLVKLIDDRLHTQELDGLTDQELELYSLRLSSYMYFAAAGQELVGVKEAIAEALYKEEYNNFYAQASGTMADKKASAELDSQSSMLVQIIYDRAQKMMASKLTYATHLLGALKRVLNRRIEQMKMNPVKTKFREDSVEV